MTFEWTENLGTPGFGDDDYENQIKKGRNDDQIRSFLISNANYFGAGGMSVGDATRKRFGLGDNYINYNTGASTDAIRAGAQKAYQNYLAQLNERKRATSFEDTLNKTRADFDDTRKRLEGEVTLYKDQFNKAKSEYDTQVQAEKDRHTKTRTDFEKEVASYKDQLSKSAASLKERDTQISRIQEESAKYQADAQRFQDLSVSSQLSALRAGASGGGAGPGAGGELSSGRAVVGSSGSGRMVDVRASVDATDSVLNRKRPVVEPLSGNAPRTAGATPVLRSGLASGAAGYYARRFG